MYVGLCVITLATISVRVNVGCLVAVVTIGLFRNLGFIHVCDLIRAHLYDRTMLSV